MRLQYLCFFVYLWSADHGLYQVLHVHYLKSSLQTGEVEIVILMLPMNKLCLQKLKYLAQNSHGWQSQNSSMPDAKASITSSKLHSLYIYHYYRWRW